MQKTLASLHTILIEPRIARNVGAIGRSCIGFGSALHACGPTPLSFDEKETRRAAIDYWDRVDFTYHDSFDLLKDELPIPPQNFIYFSSKAPTSLLDQADLFEKCFVPDDQASYHIALVFGSESKGLYDLIGEKAMQQGVTTRIPSGPSFFRSFNLAVSAEIGLWEIQRQAYQNGIQINVK
eukprot:CAMPEP_0201557120 /NCGR_PEP_ID=MMETSP0173_2-20130828/59713_1 /ASSEMBLY_ACC=CAM_ASM_000268 /TAXON_ID=218659 /ORGANISM="Vexillifera sp., Strain DIVA3 564/2" /LENGTH=180 /DNA_ID=CAMNT_0047969783 /DNA_START=403 /DNA_END=945 /DNA_ORIENTATION=-